MFEINLSNVEELVFYDRNIQKLLKPYYSYFTNWKLAQLSPGIKSFGKKAVVDFLNNFKDEDIHILENYFQTDVTLFKINSKLVENFVSSTDDLENNLINVIDYLGMASYRDENNIYISFWR